MRCATFNVLADAYMHFGDYSHVESELLEPGARTPGIIDIIDKLEADIVGLQEAEGPLIWALHENAQWQIYWTQKEQGKPDGCATLVKKGIDVSDFAAIPYDDESGHILQRLKIGRAIIANTHVKWAPPDSVNHIGVRQAEKLLHLIGPAGPAVILADSNDRANGRVRKVLSDAEFINIYEGIPTSLVNQEPVDIDVLSVRGLTARRVTTDCHAQSIPNRHCPSDHMPLLADVDIV